jgi:CRP/FNR family transcriptional regulator
MIQTLGKLDENFFANFNKTVKFKKNQLILWPQVQPLGVFYVKTGFVRQYLISKNGKELTVNILKQQTYFPIIWALNNVENIYFFESLTDVTLLRAPREEVVKQLENHPDLLYDLTKRTLSGLDGVTRIMETLVTGNAYEQISSVLLVLARRFGKQSGKKSLLIDIRLTHRLIGTLAGLSRESTSLELEKLTKNKIISRKNGLILVTNLEKLEEESSVHSTDDIIL